MKKIFRTVFIMQTCFSEFDKFNSYFVTPKTYPSIETPIREMIEAANNLIGDERISIDFICNDSFYTNIVDSTLQNINDDNDTSELLVRSVKLMQLDKRSSSVSLQQESSQQKLSLPTNRTSVGKREHDGMKIGQFVQFTMRKLNELNLVTEEEIINPQNMSYSKEVFKQNFEVLRSTDKEIIDDGGITRYYSKEKFFGDYYLSSQWYERHWELFLNWVNWVNRMYGN